MADTHNDPPVELKEPRDSGEGVSAPKGIWMRGLYMLILAFLFGVGETILVVVALVQFFWMLFSKEKNQFLADFGKDLGDWLAAVARFQAGATEDKPFPWAKWADQV